MLVSPRCPHHCFFIFGDMMMHLMSQLLHHELAPDKNSLSLWRKRLRRVWTISFSNAFLKAVGAKLASVYMIFPPALLVFCVSSHPCLSNWNLNVDPSPGMSVINTDHSSYINFHHCRIILFLGLDQNHLPRPLILHGSTASCELRH
jgi:hypothetical protein